MRCGQFREWRNWNILRRVHLPMQRRPFTALATLLALLLPAGRALACGVSASGVASCSLAEHEESTRSHWAVGASGQYTTTRLRFSDAIRGPQTRYAAQAAVAYLPSTRLVLQVGLGATFAGELVIGQERYDLSVGPLLSIGADYRVVDTGRVFLLATSALSFAAARTRLRAAPSVGYEAFDLRLGTELGVELARLLRPYALARVFGGPVFWRYHGASVSGTDTHHYQLGAGLALALSKTLHASAEGVPLGERALSFGVSAAF